MAKSKFKEKKRRLILRKTKVLTMPGVKEK